MAQSGTPVNLEAAKAAAAWMAESGVIRARFRDASGAEFELEFPSPPPGGLPFLSPPEESEPAGHPAEDTSPEHCQVCGADAPRRYRPYCRNHWLSERGVVG